MLILQASPNPEGDASHTRLIELSTVALFDPSMHCLLLVNGRRIIHFPTFSLGAKECDDAMLPTLEHASLVHSNIHGRNVDLTNEGLKEASGLGHEDTYQTLSVIVYISVSLRKTKL